MTKFENVKSKNIDEFVEWIDEHFCFDTSPYMKWWDDNYCNKCSPEIVEDPETGRDFCSTYCELHDKCKYFQGMDDIPSIKETIKMWLESEYKDGE